jgi:hypothetical protein
LEDFLEELILVDGMVGINEIFIQNITSGYYNFLGGIEGFEDIAFNIEQNDPFIVT